MAAGSFSRTAAASASLAAAWASPSAWMIFSRRSRSASACRAMARCIVSGIFTCFDFHFRYLDTPGLGILINDYLQLRVYLIALRIESMLFLEFYLGFDVA